MSLSSYARQVAYAVVLGKAVLVGLSFKSGEPNSRTGYAAQAVQFTAEGSSVDEVKFGPFRTDLPEDLVQYVVYDADKNELWRENLQRARRPLEGDVIILPPGALVFRKAED